MMMDDMVWPQCERMQWTPRSDPLAVWSGDGTRCAVAARAHVASRTHADDRLAGTPFGRVEGGDGIVERRDVADVRPQPSVPYPLDDLTQLGAVGLDDKVDRQAIGGP